VSIYVQTEGERLAGTMAYLQSEAAFEEEAYYNSWDLYDDEDPRNPKYVQAADSEGLRH
jgi:hypothetical protein